MNTLLLEQLVFRKDLDIQTAFAREAAAMLDQPEGLKTRASGQGLVLMAETEVPLAASLRMLRDQFGRQLHAMPPRIRPDACPTDAEPVMKLDLHVPAPYQWLIQANLLVRGATIVRLEEHPNGASMAAEGRLRDLLGLPGELNDITGCRAALSMRFSHFSFNPGPDAPTDAA